jgi:uncharacterized protein
MTDDAAVLPADDVLLERLPDLAIDHDNKAHYAGWLQQRLLINLCEACGEMHHPPRRRCPSCWSDRVRPVPVSGRGRIYLRVGLHQGPVTPDVDYSEPHVVVTVELDEQPGLRYASALVDPDGQAVIGDRVRLTWKERQGTSYPVWEPDPDA